MTLLQCQGVTVRFGALRALDDVGIEVNRGEIVGLLGPNGAGKTLLFDCISGLQPLERGHIYLNDDDITNAPGFWRTWQGIGRTFQDGRLFEHMTVEMNVAVGACVRGSGFASDAMLLPWSLLARRGSQRRAAAALELTGVAALGERMPKELSGADRRRVEIARALSSRPSLLLLDEPSAGVEREALDLRALLLHLRDELGIGILLVERNPGLVFSTCDFVYALDAGRIVTAGFPDDVRANADVRRSYLGVA